MGLRIQNNVEAFNTHRQLSATSSAASKSMEKLSSGYRINRAADDAAGLAISEKMRGQIGGLAQAQRNAQDGISLVQTAEGALGEVHSMLQRIRDLRVQFGNDTLSTDDRAAIRSEASALSSEIIAIRDKTQFNGLDLLDGSPATLNFQVGANDGEVVSVTTGSISAAAGMTEVVTGATYAGDAAFTALTLADVDNAIKEISTSRSEFGAVQNRLEHRLANLATYQENLVASESRIRDVDMAAEMTRFTKLNILQQAGTSMLAQANQAPQNILSLLRQ
jgi:flagellin